MLDFHRLNPNALLVLLGTVIYVVVGGPWVVAGGVAIALGLGALHRPRGAESGGDGPMSLFGTPVTAVTATAHRAWAVPAGGAGDGLDSWGPAFGECPSGGVTSLVCRGVAQPGRALGSGPRGRRFKSFRPDQYIARKPSDSLGFLLYAFVESLLSGRVVARLRAMLIHLCLSALLLTGVLQQPPTESGWTSLFNGKDFTGWKISKPESFKIEDGAIVANGAASHAFYDGPFRNHSFKNFELKVDVMTRAEFQRRRLRADRVRSGRRQRPRIRDNFPSKGFEIQVNNTYTRSGQDRQPVPRQRHQRVAGQRRRVVHDAHRRQGQDHRRQGERQADGRLDAAGGLERRAEGPGRAITGAGGTIALQAHDPNSTVYYKNIRIKPLD